VRKEIERDALLQLIESKATYVEELQTPPSMSTLKFLKERNCLRREDLPELPRKWSRHF
jgi:hypothetical protein